LNGGDSRQKKDRIMTDKTTGDTMPDGIKATDEQIDRWEKLASKKITDTAQRRREMLEKQYEQQIRKWEAAEQKHHSDPSLPPPDNMLEILAEKRNEHLNMIDCREQAFLKSLQVEVNYARETGFILDPDYTPLHTREQIAAWADSLKRPPVFDDPRSEAEQLDFDEGVGFVFETGRIPDADYCRENGLPSPVPDKDRGMER
jgi:hypothetical protein